MAGAGRPKGMANKNKEFLLKKLQDMYGDEFDPIMKMAENAKRMQDIAVDLEGAKDKDGDPDHEAQAKEFGARIKCTEAWDRVAQYTQPKLKAVEVDMTVKGDKENPIEIKVGLDDELAEQLYRDLCNDE